MRGKNTTLLSNPGTQTRTVLGILLFAEILDVTPREVESAFAKYGLPRKMARDPFHPISPIYELEIQGEILAKSALGYSNITLAGLIAASFDASKFGVLGLAAQNAPTLSQALQLTSKYPQLTWGQCQSVMNFQDATFTVEFSMAPPKLTEQPETVAEALATIHVAAATIMAGIIGPVLHGDELKACRIFLPFRKPDDWALLAGNLPAEVNFDADKAYVDLPTDQMDVKFRNASPLFYSMYMQQAKVLAKNMRNDVPFSEVVRQYISAYTPPLSRREVADQLGITERHLSRRLALEGTSFRELVVVVQTARARQLLQQNMKIEDVAIKLGYAETATFSRAFTNWTGESPTYWQKSPKRQSKS